MNGDFPIKFSVYTKLSLVQSLNSPFFPPHIGAGSGQGLDYAVAYNTYFELGEPVRGTGTWNTKWRLYYTA